MLFRSIQISGVFNNVIEDDGKPVYIQTIGKTALSYREKELVGHGTNTHPDGFGSPIGKLKGINLSIEDMGPRDLRAYDIYEAESVTLEFEGNIIVSGEIITGSRNLQGEIILISFKNCTVTHNDIVLFQPEWGIYDMAVGKKVTSVFSGPADVSSFDMITHVQKSATIKAKKTDEKTALEHLYEEVRTIRETKNNTANLITIFNNLKENHPNDWLLSIEIIEILNDSNEINLKEEIIDYLENLKQNRSEIAHLISGGLELIFKSEMV